MKSSPEARATPAHRALARACGIGVGTVGTYCQRARQAGVTWPVPAERDDAELEARLFRRVHDLVGVVRSLPDMARLHQELKQPWGHALQRLHLEYLTQHPTSYRYSQFCRYYGRTACGPVTVTANCIQSDTYPPRHL